MDAQNFLRYRRIKNTSLLSSLCACFSDAVVTWPCDVIAVSHLLDIIGYECLTQLELCRKNICHTGHHITMASFESVAYVHNRRRSKYNTAFTQLYLITPYWDLCIRAKFVEDKSFSFLFLLNKKIKDSGHPEAYCTGIEQPRSPKYIWFRHFGLIQAF